MLPTRAGPRMPRVESLALLGRTGDSIGCLVMNVYRGLGSLPLPAAPSVVTVGFFDGVHRGHQAVLGRAVEAARQRGARSVALTFDRHPREILSPGEEPRLLTTVERKASLIEDLAVEALVLIEFTKE